MKKESVPATRDQSRFDWIVLNVPADLLEFFSVADQVVVALILPERRTFSQHAIRLMGSEPFERSQPMAGSHIRSYQQVHVVRHHHEGMQLVTMKPSFTVADGINHNLRDFILPQEEPDR